MCLAGALEGCDKALNVLKHIPICESGPLVEIIAHPRSTQ